jgi:mannosyltransferase OCH1-like enzyme
MECTESKDHISTKTKVASHLQPDAVDSLNGAGNTIKDHTNLSPSNQLDSQSSRIAEDMFDKFEDVLQDQHTRLTPQPPPQDMWLISSSESTRQQTNRIPKIINRIYFAKDGNYPAVVSNAIKQAHKSWLDNNPGYHVRYFNLIKARRYLLKHFHPVFLRAFDCIEAFAGKSDLFRMALLYREGGFHADWKTVCLEKNLLERISNGTDFFVTKGFFAALDYGVSGFCSTCMKVLFRPFSLFYHHRLLATGWICKEIS